MNKNSGFGDVTNCNSLNNSVVSSPTVNSIRRNSFYKLTNVLLLLFLVFGSCVVSFGMLDDVNDKNKGNSNHKSNVHTNNNNTDIINTNIEKCYDQISSGEDLFLSFANGLITGIGGYNNTWKPLKENWGLYWYRSNPWLAYGLNKHIYDSNYIDVDLHILGINFLAFLESIIIRGIHNEINPAMSSEDFLKQVQKTWQEKIAIIITNLGTLLGINTLQILDFEIKVFKYWSISLNFTVVLYLLSSVIYYTLQNKNDTSQNNNDM